MQTTRTLARLAAFGLFVILVAAGCQPAAVLPDAASLASAEADADALATGGDYAGAAARLEQLAGSARGEIRTRALIGAARYRLEAGEPSLAQRRLDAIDGSLAPADRAAVTVLRARIDVLAERPAEALARLDGVERPLPDPVAGDYFATRADALFRLDRVQEAVEAMVQRDGRMASEADRLDNRRRLWSRLQQARSIPSPTGSRDPVVAGWLALGQALAAANRNPFGLRAAVLDWRASHPDHPAAGRLSDEVLDQYRALMSYPAQVALLLPVSGRQRSSAAAVRDGFFAAYFLHAEREERPAVRVYDTAELGALAAYQSAVADGADFVVGPLTKPSLDDIARSDAASVPTLALNATRDASRLATPLYQFSLSPEDEAEQAAQRILMEGHSRGVALVPRNDWGMRIAASFGEALQAGGGRLLALKPYDPAAADFGEPITDMLYLNESRARHRRAQQDLGLNLEFEPRRRQDIEFIFLAALPRQARLIRPQLGFHFADDLPVFATSTVYEPGHRDNDDLDGIMFDDMPWTLGSDPTALRIQEDIARYWPSRAARRARLYALGFDAYRLVPVLYGGTGALDQGLAGMTGRLTADESGRIRRELEWARMSGGRPVPLAPDMAGGAP